VTWAVTRVACFLAYVRRLEIVVETLGPVRAWLGGPYSSDDPEEGKQDAQENEAPLALQRAEHQAAEGDCVCHDVAREMHGVLFIGRSIGALEWPGVGVSICTPAAERPSMRRRARSVLQSPTKIRPERSIRTS
jgi:hypothetical protein